MKIIDANDMLELKKVDTAASETIDPKQTNGGLNLRKKYRIDKSDVMLYSQIKNVSTVPKKHKNADGGESGKTSRRSRY